MEVFRRRAVAAVLVVGFLLTGCGGTEEGHTECSCAAGTTYKGSFYQQYANTSVKPDASIGRSDILDDCCGDPVAQVAVYSIEGIDPTIAIATEDAQGNTYFNVATGLSDRDQEIAERFAKAHHQAD